MKKFWVGYDLTLGIENIDQAHGIINQLVMFAFAVLTKEQLPLAGKIRAVDTLQAFFETHFFDEEATIPRPSAEVQSHQADHQRLITLLINLRQALETHQTVDPELHFQKINQWVQGHIYHFDRHLPDFLPTTTQTP